MKKALVVCMATTRKKMMNVRKALEDSGWHCSAVERERLRPSSLKGVDLVVTVGGDGTFLRTSHQIKDDTPILGVNSDPKRKEGFYTSATVDNFRRKFKGKWKLLKVGRLEARLDGKELGVLALNEFFVSHVRPHHSSLYDISIGKKKEFHKSSGVIVATAAGSHAWAKSAGGRKMPLQSKRFQYVVRDSYRRKLLNPKLVRGILHSDQKVKITSHMDKGFVTFDSVHKEYKFKKGSVIEIRKSKKDLLMMRL